MIEEPKDILDISSGLLDGEEIITSIKRISNLEGVFRDDLMHSRSIIQGSHSW